MSSEKAYPDYVIKALNGGKFTIYRFNMNCGKFAHDSKDGYIYDEEYRTDKYCINLYLHLLSHSFYDLFTLDYPKSFAIKGGTNLFRIIVTETDIKHHKSQEVNGTISGHINDKLYYCLSYSGQFNWVKRTKKKKKKRKIPYASIAHDGKKNSLSVPHSVQWSANNPLQGGRFTPK